MSLPAWEAMDEDEPGELVDGRLEEEELPDSPHEVVVCALLFALTAWARGHGGRAFGPDLKYALDSARGRKPDISVFATRSRRLPRRGATRHPPDLVVEVLSPSPRDRLRDRIVKLQEYARFGVRYYWLVDPEVRSIEVLRLGDDGHYTLVLAAFEGSVEVPGFAGLTIDLDELWRELDETIEDARADAEG